MDWAWIAGSGWILLAFGVAVIIGRSIALADRRRADDVDDDHALILLTEQPPPPDSGPELADISGSSRHATQESSTGGQPSASPTVRETPPIPGIPVARPRVGRRSDPPPG